MDWNKVSAFAAVAQAVMSVAAIGWADWHARRGERGRRDATASLAWHFHEYLTKWLTEVSTACSNGSHADIQEATHVLQEIVRIGDAVQLHDLSAQAVGSVVHMRSIAAVAQSLAQQALASSKDQNPSFNSAHWAQEFSELHVECLRAAVGLPPDPRPEDA